MKRGDNKRTFRLTMLGLLCGGLLLTGIGAGIQLVEASTLTYGYRAAAELARSCGFRESMYLTEGGFQPGPLPETQEPAGNTIRRTFL